MGLKWLAMLFALVAFAGFLPTLIGASNINKDGSLLLNEPQFAVATGYAQNMMHQHAAALAWQRDNLGYVGVIPEGVGNLDDYLDDAHVELHDWTSEVRANGFVVTYPTAALPGHVNNTKFSKILARVSGTPFSGLVTAAGVEGTSAPVTAETYGLAAGTPVFASAIN